MKYVFSYRTESPVNHKPIWFILRHTEKEYRQWKASRRPGATGVKIDGCNHHVAVGRSSAWCNKKESESYGWKHTVHNNMSQLVTENFVHML